jgi:hypothetical protein
MRNIRQLQSACLKLQQMPLHSCSKCFILQGPIPVSYTSAMHCTSLQVFAVKHKCRFASCSVCKTSEAGEQTIAGAMCCRKCTKHHMLYITCDD